MLELTPDFFLVLPVQMPHPTRHVTVNSFHQQMVVIRHLTIGVHIPVKSLTHLTQYLKPALAIKVINVDILPPIPTPREVM